MPRIRTVMIALALVTTLVAAAPGQDGAAPCTAVRDGSTVTLTWNDNGGKHIVRRDGRWLATPGVAVGSHVDAAAPAGSTYEIRTWLRGTRTDTACTEGASPPTTAPTTTAGPTTTTTTAAPTTTTTAPPPGDGGCTATRSANRVDLQWVDDGGRHVVRRNGRWVATLDGTGRYTDANAPAGASYEIRTWLRGARTDIACTDGGGPTPTTTTSTTTSTVAPPPDGAVSRVLHVSIDALRSDHVNASLTPRLASLMRDGAATRNARTDHGLTKTLPNHTSQFTGRPVWGAGGHKVDFNQDNLQTVHDAAGTHIESIFDVVDDNGGHTAVFAGKTKFDFLHRTWRDSIDTYRRSDPANLVADALTALRTGPGPTFVSYHVRLPDTAGHESGWSTSQYDDAVQAADVILGRLIDGIRNDGTLQGTTAIIITSDHGGPNTGLLHDDATQAANYTVPFVVWGPGVGTGVDLYALNQGNRADPGTGRPGHNGTQPIRGHEMANLALDLLGLPPVPGSVVNVAQDLRVR